MADQEVVNLINEKYKLASTPEEKSLVEQAAKRFGVSLPTLGGAPPQAPPPSMTDKLGATIGQGFDWLGQQATGLGRSLNRNFIEPAKVFPKIMGDFSNQPNPWEGVKNVFREDIGPMFNAIGEGVLSQERQAGREITSGQPLQGIQRAVLGAVPVVGPQIAGALDKAAAGDIGEATGDVLSAVSMFKGPAAMEGLTNRVVGGMGRGRTAAGIRQLPGWEKIPVDDQVAIQNLADLNGIQMKRGLASQAQINKTSAIVDRAMGKVDEAVSAYGGVDPKTVEMVQPVMDLINHYEKAGLPERAAPLRQTLTNLVENHSGMRRLTDPKSGRVIETPEAYLSRVSIQDPGKALPYWQDLKRTFGKINKENMATKTMAEVMESGTGTGVFDTLVERGLRNRIRELAPDVQKWNQEASNAISLRKMLEDFSQTNPTATREILPWVMGSVGLGVAEGLGFGASHTGMPMEAMGLLSPAVITGIVMRAAGRDPAVNARLGALLSGYSRSRVAGGLNQVIGNLPKGRALTIGQESPK